jgi:hypothetical protein
MGEVTNFARFYKAFNRMPYHGDREELKRQIVLQYTWNRTDSLREMTRREYDACCAALEKLTGVSDLLRKRRSRALHMMQRMGINTADWECINRFCLHPRIAGKPFGRIRLEEFDELDRKLRAIERKGGLAPRTAPDKPEPPVAAYLAAGPCGEA